MKKLLLTTLYWGILIALIGIIGHTTFSRHTLYFDYDSVEPKVDKIKIGEPLVMVSVNEYYKEIPIKWVDTLRCDGLYHFSQSVLYGTPEKREIAVVDWVYQGELPTTPTTCFMESVIQTQTIIRAEQKIISGPFSFVE